MKTNSKNNSTTGNNRLATGSKSTLGTNCTPVQRCNMSKYSGSRSFGQDGNIYGENEEDFYSRS